MSILNVPSSYPPGYGGNPYTPVNIDVFYDLNWPPVFSGVQSEGFPSLSGLRGLGCGCSETDEDGNCLDPDPCSTGSTDTSSLPISLNSSQLDSQNLSLSTLTPATVSAAIPSSGCVVGATDTYGNTVASCGNVSNVISSAGITPATPSGYSGPNVLSGSASTPAAPSGYQWATIINAAGQNLAKVLTLAQGGSVVTLANGASIDYGSATTATTAAATGSFNIASLNSSLATTTGMSTGAISMIELVVVGLIAYSLVKGGK